VLALVDHFCRASRRRIESRFGSIHDNDDAVGYRLAQQVLADGMPWLSAGGVGEAVSGTASMAPESVRG
jgi:hypothetical protein